MVMRFFLAMALSLFFYEKVRADSDRDFTALAAFGTNYKFPGSVRVGWADWEVGMLTPTFYGFSKVFDINDFSYTAFGLGVSSTFGFYGGIGVHYSWWKIGVRGELTATMDVNAFTQATGIVGLAWGF